MAKRQLQALRLPKPAVLRVWASRHGFEVGEKGRISHEVECAYLDRRYDYLARAQKRFRTQGLA